MSDQPTPSLVLIDEPTVEQKKQWLSDWKNKVQNEISGYSEEREKLFAIYRKQKEMYDGWLNLRMKKIKKYDVVMNNRKKVLMDIEKELAILESNEQVKT
jgi:hypothetical protein